MNKAVIVNTLSYYAVPYANLQPKFPTIELSSNNSDNIIKYSSVHLVSSFRLSNNKLIKIDPVKKVIISNE